MLHATTMIQSTRQPSLSVDTSIGQCLWPHIMSFNRGKRKSTNRSRVPITPPWPWNQIALIVLLLIGELGGLF